MPGTTFSPKRPAANCVERASVFQTPLLEGPIPADARPPRFPATTSRHPGPTERRKEGREHSRCAPVARPTLATVVRAAAEVVRLV
jgi:hypothetical protein